MNDFTKEELEEIHEILDICYADTQFTNTPQPELLKKLQSMIDNYCEHESAEDEKYPSEFLWHKCDKCAKEFK